MVHKYTFVVDTLIRKKKSHVLPYAYISVAISYPNL